MSETVPLDWNEILIVSKHKDQVSCWTAWRRDIAAFADPRLWESLDDWPAYFRAQPASAGWGMEGYGIIVMDLDRKVSWSINDYSMPTSLFLPSDSVVLGEDRKDGAALRQLLARPDVWPDIKFRLFPAPGLVSALLSGVTKPAAPSVTQATLADLINPSLSIEEAFQALTITRGTLKWKGQAWLTQDAEISPSGWRCRNSIGTDPVHLLIQFLEDMRSGNFPAPDWNNIKEQANQYADDIDEEEANALMVRLDSMEKGWRVSRSVPSL